MGGIWIRVKMLGFLNECCMRHFFNRSKCANKMIIYIILYNMKSFGLILNWSLNMCVCFISYSPTPKTFLSISVKSMNKFFAVALELGTSSWKWEKKRTTWPKSLLFQMEHFMLAILTCTVKPLTQFSVIHWFLESHLFHLKKVWPSKE